MLPTHAFEFFIIPFGITVIIAGVISIVGQGYSRISLLPACAGISISWVFAMIMGASVLMPEPGMIALPYVILAGLILGSILDHFVPKWTKNNPNLIQLFFDALFTLIIILSFRYEFEYWTFLIVFIWSSILYRSRRLSKDPRLPVVMMIAAAVGLASIAWISGNYIERNLAFGITSAGLGLLAWLLIKTNTPLGFNFFWSSYSTLLLVAMKISNNSPYLLIPIFLLSFVFYSDSILFKIKTKTSRLMLIMSPLILACLSMLPIVLASILTLILTSEINL